MSDDLEKRLARLGTKADVAWAFAIFTLAIAAGVVAVGWVRSGMPL